MEQRDREITGFQYNHGVKAVPEKRIHIEARHLCPATEIFPEQDWETVLAAGDGGEQTVESVDVAFRNPRKEPLGIDPQVIRLERIGRDSEATGLWKFEISLKVIVSQALVKIRKSVAYGDSSYHIFSCGILGQGDRETREQEFQRQEDSFL